MTRNINDKSLIDKGDNIKEKKTKKIIKKTSEKGGYDGQDIGEGDKESLLHAAKLKRYIKRRRK